jgi:hypothetical protein
MIPFANVRKPKFVEIGPDATSSTATTPGATSTLPQTLRGKRIHNPPHYIVLFLAYGFFRSASHKSRPSPRVASRARVTATNSIDLHCQVINFAAA